MCSVVLHWQPLPVCLRYNMEGQMQVGKLQEVLRRQVGVHQQKSSDVPNSETSVTQIHLREGLASEDKAIPPLPEFVSLGPHDWDIGQVTRMRGIQRGLNGEGVKSSLDQTIHADVEVRQQPNVNIRVNQIISTSVAAGCKAMAQEVRDGKLEGFRILGGQGRAFQQRAVWMNPSGTERLAFNEVGGANRPQGRRFARRSVWQSASFPEQWSCARNRSKLSEQRRARQYERISSCDKPQTPQQSPTTLELIIPQGVSADEVTAALAAGA